MLHQCAAAKRQRRWPYSTCILGSSSLTDVMSHKDLNIMLVLLPIQTNFGQVSESC